MKYTKLFSAKKINQCEISNRLVVTAMVTNYCDENGNATERYIRYHEEKAKGGFGLIITEDYAISKLAKGYTNVACLYEDSQIESHKNLTDRIHQYDTKIFAQIYHAGRQSSPLSNGGQQVVSSSPLPCLALKEMPRELTIDEIHEIVKQFGETALRAKKAGFDGIEIHTAHGYLLQEFLSPLDNKRTDIYGGSFEGRVRIVKEVIEEVRSKVGKGYPVIVRMNADDGVIAGISKIEAITYARLLESWGVDGIDVSAGIYGGDRGNNVDMYSEAGWITELASLIKQQVKIPIISSYRFTDPIVADTALAIGRCDFIGMGRQTLADPHFPIKAKEYRFDDIRRCIACNQGCFMGLFVNGETSCLVNPNLGKEYLDNYKKAENSKEVVVIGGGIAGMEAAIVAAKKGHHVTVYEKSNRIGGQWISAAYPPFKTDLATLPRWMEHTANKLNIKIHLNTTVDEEMVKNFHADVIILASGGEPLRPNIKGVDHENVYTAEECLLGKNIVSGNVVICGGGEVGCETAEVLATRASHVDIVEMKPSILSDSYHAGGILPILKQYNVGIHTNSRVEEFSENSVLVSQNGIEKSIPADYIILAFGYKSNNILKDACEANCKDVRIIGNASRVKNGLQAILDGYMIAIDL